MNRATLVGVGFAFATVVGGRNGLFGRNTIKLQANEILEAKGVNFVLATKIELVFKNATPPLPVYRWYFRPVTLELKNNGVTTYTYL